MQRIRYLRYKEGYTLEEVAAKIGVTKQMVSLWELGKGRVSDRYKVKLAELYGVPVEEIIQ